MADSIFISTDMFGDVEPESLLLLERSGYGVRMNRQGRKMTPEELAGEANDVEVLIAGTEDLGPLLDASESLKMISRVGIGLDGVPLERCQRRGIAVSWTPDAVTMAVAELTIGLMLDITRYVGSSNLGFRNFLWKRQYGFRLGNCVIGLIGFGRIGSNVAQLLLSFSPKEILVYDSQNKVREIEKLRELGLNIRATSIEKVIKSSNIISLHVPLYDKTWKLIGRSEITAMQKGTFLVNTSRGGIIDEAALHDALFNDHLGGAAVDVFEQEPYAGSLIELENIVLTPHLGSCSIDCRMRMEQEAAEEALRFLDGKPLLREVPSSEYDYQTKRVS